MKPEGGITMTGKKLISVLLTLVMSVSVFMVNIPVINAEADSPDFSITKSIDRTSFTEGESGKLTYTFIPSGKAPAENKKDADIVMLLDISTSMEDSDKIVKAVDAAVQFFNKLNGTGFKASLVTFGYKVGYSSNLTTSYSTLINQVNKYKQYSWFSGYYNLMMGTNYNDALKKAKQILASGTAKNKYVLFITDGMPNYFTSTTRISKYDNNIYREAEGNTYYYTNHPKSTPEAYSNAVNDVEELAGAGIEVFTLGVGKGNEVDMDFLQELTQAGSGKLYQVVDPNSMSDIFAQISEDICDISISGIKIKERLPEGISLGSNSNASIDEDGYVVINVPPITYKKNSSLPPEPFAVDLNIVMNRIGSYVLDDSKVQYKNWNGQAAEKPINSVSIGVTAAEGAPALKLSKAMLNSSAIVGENISLEYKIIPEGVFNSQAESDSPVDMVILFDKSSNMQYNYGNGNNRKYVLEKEVAVNLVNTVKAMNNGSRVGYIEYNRYAKSVKALTSNYQSVIDSINLTSVDSIPDHESGVNYESALNSAKKMLEGSTRQKMIVLLTGSRPDYYEDEYEDHKSYDYYKNYDKDFKAYLDANKISKNQYNWTAAYNSYYNSKLSGKYDIAYGYYAYLDTNKTTSGLPYTEAKAVAGGLQDTLLHVMAIGKYHENSSDSDDDYNLNYLRSLSGLTGGSTYEYAQQTQLYNAIKAPEAAALEYRMRNLVITEQFPAGIEILENDKITVSQSNPSKFTVVLPDIVFTDGMGTPSPVVLNIKVKFSSEGEYNLSDVSKLEYVDNDGSAKVLNFNKLKINVANPNYRIDKLVASKSYEGEAFKGIFLDWNGNLLNNMGAISRFIVMKSINGSLYEEVTRLNKDIFTYLDTDTGTSGRYVYRIDVLLNNGDIVVGIPSNEVLLLGKGKTNIGAVSQSIQINGQIITKAYESYKLNYEIGLSILNGTEGKTEGGIKEAVFDIALNSAGNTDILYSVKDGTIKLIDSNGAQISDNLSLEIRNNGTANAGLVIAYDGILAPGSYKIVFEAEPRKAMGTVLPEQGTEVIMQLNIRWKDVGLDNIINDSSNAFDETDGTKQLQYKLWILPLPKLL